MGAAVHHRGRVVTRHAYDVTPMGGISEHPTTVEAKIAAALERLGQAQRTLLQHTATAHGVSPIQARIVERLARATRTAHRPAELAVEFGVTRATISDALAALARKQLITRRADGADGRQVLLALTPSGHELAADLDGWSAPVQARLATLAPTDQAALLSTLLRLIAGLQDHGVISTSRMCVTCRFFRPQAHPADPAPHHCTLLGTALAERELRIDCPEHQECA